MLGREARGWGWRVGSRQHLEVFEATRENEILQDESTEGVRTEAFRDSGIMLRGARGGPESSAPDNYLWARAPRTPSPPLLTALASPSESHGPPLLPTQKHTTWPIPGPLGPVQGQRLYYIGVRTSTSGREK